MTPNYRMKGLGQTLAPLSGTQFCAAQYGGGPNTSFSLPVGLASAAALLILPGFWKLLGAAGLFAAAASFCPCPNKTSSYCPSNVGPNGMPVVPTSVQPCQAITPCTSCACSSL